MSRYDSHIHLFERGYRGESPPNSEFDKYEQLRDRYGVTRALVIGYEGSADHQGNNEYIVELADCHDWVAPVVFLGPQRPQSAQLAEEWFHRGVVGCSLYLGNDGTQLDAFERTLWDLLSDCRAIVSVNATPAAWATAADWARSIPGARVLVSHLGMPGAVAPEPTRVVDRLAPVLDLAELENVSVKLSGLYAIDPDFPHRGASDVVETVLQTFGPERVLWGSDYSPALEVVEEHELFDLPYRSVHALSADALLNLLGGNLRRLLDEVKTP